MILDGGMGSFFRCFFRHQISGAWEITNKNGRLKSPRQNASFPVFFVTWMAKLDATKDNSPSKFESTPNKKAYYQDLQIHWQNCQMNPPSNYHRDVFSLNLVGKKTFVQGPRPAILDRKLLPLSND